MAPHTFYARRGKRWFDALAAGSGLLVLLPVLILLALASLALQGRPLFFVQRRVGRQGKPITLWKLRTMNSRESEDSSITVGGDPRVTPWGRWLRRFKMDELPQLWCVLKGDMCLVGPRPDVEGYWDRVFTSTPESWLRKQLDKEGWGSPLLDIWPYTAPSSKVVG